MSPSPIAIGVGNDARPGALLLASAQRQPPPAQRQPPGPGQAEFVICDQTIERLNNKLKQFRAVATRYDKTAASYLAFVQLAASRLWLRFVHTT
jgi:transposase